MKYSSTHTSIDPNPSTRTTFIGTVISLNKQPLQIRDLRSFL